MADKEKVIKLIEEEISVCESVNQCYRTIDLPALRDILAVIKEQDQMYYTLEHDWRMCRELLKEQEAKPPVHIHEEYPEHDWERKENGDIDDFAYDGDYHNGPMCKRCYYSFCIHCDPDGWNKEPCIIDKYKCPKCERYISKGTKFCSDCGQAVKWE